MAWYGLGRSLVGWVSPLVWCCTVVVAQAPHSAIAATVTSGNNLNRGAEPIGQLLAKIIL
jgi:hypothetical protein